MLVRLPSGSYVNPAEVASVEGVASTPSSKGCGKPGCLNCAGKERPGVPAKVRITLSSGDTLVALTVEDDADLPVSVDKIAGLLEAK